MLGPLESALLDGAHRAFSKDCCSEILRLIPSLARFTQHCNRGSRALQSGKEEGAERYPDRIGRSKTLFIHGLYHLKRRKF